MKLEHDELGEGIGRIELVRRGRKLGGLPILDGPLNALAVANA